ncbi:hypothetical protein K0U27_06765 [archaeon]|nr:hypothetical protein [archaeon]
MRMITRKNNNMGTKNFKHVPRNIISTSPSNATIILTLPQRPGGEMYGM